MLNYDANGVTVDSDGFTHIHGGYAARRIDGITMENLSLDKAEANVVVTYRYPDAADEVHHGAFIWDRRERKVFARFVGGSWTPVDDWNRFGDTFDRNWVRRFYGVDTINA